MFTRTSTLLDTFVSQISERQRRNFLSLVAFHHCTIPFACFATCVVLSSPLKSQLQSWHNPTTKIQNGIHFSNHPLIECKQALNTENMINHNNGKQWYTNNTREYRRWKIMLKENRNGNACSFTYSYFGSNLWFKWDISILEPNSSYSFGRGR